MSGEDGRIERKSSPAPPMSAALRAAVLARSTPVRPLLSPEYRAGAVLGAGFVVAAVYLAVNGLRADAPRLGPLVVWLPAMLRVAAGAWLILLATREASPSDGAPSRIRTAALLVVPLLLAGSAEALARVGLGGAGVGPLRCYGEVIALAIPATLLAGWLLERAYPLRPVFASIAAVVGVGLLAETALHLTCPSTSPAHTLLIHGGALATAAAAGAALGWGRLRSRMRGAL